MLDDEMHVMLCANYNMLFCFNNYNIPYKGCIDSVMTVKRPGGRQEVGSYSVTSPWLPVLTGRWRTSSSEWRRSPLQKEIWRYSVSTHKHETPVWSSRVDSWETTQYWWADMVWLIKTTEESDKYLFHHVTQWVRSHPVSHIFIWNSLANICSGCISLGNLCPTFL